MKIKLVKETKLNGDIFYYVYKDEEYVSNSVVYGGNESYSEELQKERHQEAVDKYNRYLNMQGKFTIETILEKEI